MLAKSIDRVRRHRRRQYIRDEIRDYLLAKGTDVASVSELGAELGLHARVLLAAAYDDPELAIAGSDNARFVYSLHRAVTAGFAVTQSRGRTVLQYTLENSVSGPLFVDGHFFGQDRQFHLSELGNAVVTLSIMARAWTPPDETASSETPSLFELITEAWRRVTGPVWRSGRLEVYRAHFDRSIGRCPWQGGST
ncbi:MAG: hypothetical protein ACRDRL_12315, partial [Sciscionella sp.]